MFDPNGSIRNSFNLRLPRVMEIAIDDWDRVYVTSSVFGKAFDLGGPQAVLSVVGSDEHGLRHLVEVDPDAIIPPRYILPGPNPVRVVAHGERVAVFFPASGVVDVFVAGDLQTTVRVCVPEELQGIYKTQLDNATGETTSQRWIGLITDVFIEDDGTINIVGPLQINRQYHGISRFDSEGNPKGTVVAPTPTFGLPREIRFLLEPFRLAAFGSDGEVVVLELWNPPA